MGHLLIFHGILHEFPQLVELLTHLLSQTNFCILYLGTIIIIDYKIADMMVNINFYACQRNLRRSMDTNVSVNIFFEISEVSNFYSLGRFLLFSGHRNKI